MILEKNIGQDEERRVDRLGKILCFRGNQSGSVCMSKKCQRTAFMCSIRTCECHQDHKKCLTVPTEKFLENILQKITPTKQIEQCISSKIQKIIDQLSDLKDNLIDQINKKLKYFGLNNKQYELLQKVEQKNYDKLTGKQISYILNQLESQQNQQQSINKIVEIFKNQIDQICKCQEDAIKKIKSQLFKQIIILEQYIINDGVKYNSVENKLFFNSKIIKTNKNIENIKEFFTNKEIVATKLLFRASQNNFLASKFHQMCDNKPNTLTVCETQHGKLIGGFTPIICNKVPNGKYTSDPKKQSFIFSLSNNEKLQIITKNQQYEIECHSQCGPIFGDGYDLYICNKANEDNRSSGNIGSTYGHKNYTSINQQSWKRFSGANLSYNFRIKEWEVWQMILYQE